MNANCFMILFYVNNWLQFPKVASQHPYLYDKFSLILSEGCSQDCGQAAYILIIK